MARIVKSVLYTIGFSGLGYCLLQLTTTNESEVLPHLPERFPSERQEARKKLVGVLDVLQAAAESEEPLYRMTKEQLEQTVIHKKR